MKPSRSVFCSVAALIVAILTLLLTSAAAAQTDSAALNCSMACAGKAVTWPKGFLPGTA
jgi:hypothetical protein